MTQDVPAEVFARAASAVVSGELSTLQRLLAATPHLVRAQSPAPFRAPLIHYCAANGVENDLQCTPANAVAICQALLDAGAEPDALSEAYGGGANATALCLLASSWHPHERGVQADIARCLVRGGAAINGTQDNGAPLATALVFGYTRTAFALADEGARIDNIFFAAGIGDLDRVRAFAPAKNIATSDARGSYQPVVALGDRQPAHPIQEAFHFAVTHGHQAVAAYLLQQGADPNGSVPGHHCELPLLQAAFVHQTDIALWLLTQGADPNRKDGKRYQTPLQHVQTHGPKALLTAFS